MGYKKALFIMAYQARQIFYVNNPFNEKWSVVLKGRSINKTHDDDTLDIPETY